MGSLHRGPEPQSHRVSFQIFGCEFRTSDVEFLRPFRTGALYCLRIECGESYSTSRIFHSGTVFPCNVDGPGQHYKCDVLLLSCTRSGEYGGAPVNQRFRTEKRHAVTKGETQYVSSSRNPVVYVAEPLPTQRWRDQCHIPAGGRRCE